MFFFKGMSIQRKVKIVKVVSGMFQSILPTGHDDLSNIIEQKKKKNGTYINYIHDFTWVI